MLIFPWPRQNIDPEERWGAVFFVLGLAFDLFVQRDVEVTGFTVRVLTLLAACFLGPALVRLVGHFSGREWSGLALGAITLACCTGLTVIFRFLLRAYP